ncbi:tripartite ATP-independent transporter solute receptor, DctP family [Oscillibacter sp. PC13]|uniref:TRAP transporter substrate-binding protein n=1 Tax=Oscillibacter sp. PC13 TaxID=1855299 RepID=UPI0008E37E4C|nr:TRAP transporter substrate-binding protein [Oscillibacter sp. PC13]SFQ18707.1 tripartite ATP-independent transporter solute receptor, DctP family [Oscillibacter sp. PC13]
MKRMLSVVLALLMVLSLAACGGSDTSAPADGDAASGAGAASGEVLQLTLAHTLDSEHPVHLGAEYFADRLEELSGGTMVTTVHPNSGLGGEDEVVEMQSYGDSVTFSVPSGCALQNYAPAMYAADFYFQFANYDQVWAFYDGEYGDYVKNSLDGTGLVVTYFWDNGFRNLTTTSKEVHTAADLKGVKIRVMNAETHLAAWNAIGAAATPIAYSEVYSSLQQGVVDGQENPVFNIIGSRFQEVQKNLIMTRHVHDVSPFIISGTAWESWTDEQRGWVEQASQEAGDYMRQQAVELEDVKLQDLKDAGMNVYELTDAERQTFVDAVKDVPAQFADKMGSEAYELYQKCIAEAQKAG